ncbi:MAG: hypothetical protein ACIAXF_07530 [Phycisphaerales bacterium JB063]
MMARLFALMVLGVGGGMLPGCAWMVSGLDGKVSHTVGSGEWDEVTHSYLSIGSVPEGALVYVQVTTEYEMNIRAGVDLDRTDGDRITSQWTTLGSTPVLNFRVASSGSDVDRKLGSTARSTFRLTNVRVRVEKPGYETREFEHVALSAEEEARPRLVVELVPVEDGTSEGE